jgi:hypothetical protein
MVPLALLPSQVASLGDPLQLLFEVMKALLDTPAVDFELRFAGAAAANPTSQA